MLTRGPWDPVNLPHPRNRRPLSPGARVPDRDQLRVHSSPYKSVAGVLLQPETRARPPSHNIDEIREKSTSSREGDHALFLHHGFSPMWPIGHRGIAMALHRPTGIIPRPCGMMQGCLEGRIPRRGENLAIGPLYNVANSALSAINSSK
jgi:hypothetical protein